MNRGNSLRLVVTSAVLACVVLGGAAQADDIVKVNRKVVYLDQSVGTEEIRECHWDEKLVDYLEKYAKGRVQVTDEDIEKVHGKALRLTAVAIHSSGGAAFSGPKWLKLRAELLVDGKVVNNFEKSSHSTVDPFRWTACSVMVKMSKQLGSYTAKWLRKPVNVIDTGDDDSPDTSEPEAQSPDATPPAAAPAPAAAPPAQKADAQPG